MIKCRGVWLAGLQYISPYRQQQVCASITMGMLAPTALAPGLLSLFQQQLDSLWSGLAILFCWLRILLGWLDPGKEQPQVRGEPKETQETQEDGNSAEATTPVSVNYHFTRQCNYKCGFCFHTAKTSFVLPLEEAKRGLLLLKEAGKFLDQSEARMFQDSCT